MTAVDEFLEGQRRWREIKEELRAAEAAMHEAGNEWDALARDLALERVELEEEHLQAQGQVMLALEELRGVEARVMRHNAEGKAAEDEVRKEIRAARMAWVEVKERYDEVAEEFGKLEHDALIEYLRSRP